MGMDRRTNRVFNAALKRAGRVARDPQAVASLVDRASRKAERSGGARKALRDGLGVLVRMLRAWYRGEYQKVPWNTVLWATAALIYFLWPLDAVPDFLLGIGLIDDIAVLTFVLRAIRQDLQAFLEWEIETGRAMPPGAVVEGT